MLFVTEGGHGPTVEVMSRTKLDADAIRRERALEMLRRRLRGWTVEEVARFFRCTERWVWDQIAQIPDAEKRRVAREVAHGSGEVSLAV